MNMSTMLPWKLRHTIWRGAEKFFRSVSDNVPAIRLTAQYFFQRPVFGRVLTGLYSWSCRPPYREKGGIVAVQRQSHATDE